MALRSKLGRDLGAVNMYGTKLMSKTETLLIYSFQDLTLLLRLQENYGITITINNVILGL